MRRCVLAVTAAVLATAAPAAGDGGPPQNAVQGWDGLARGALRYVAVPSVGWTSVQVINRRGGRVVQFMNVKGNWGVPVVTADGGRDALLRDNRTLVLGQVTGGMNLRKQSSFLLVDTKSLSITRTIHLAGHLAFDAVSPDARYIYFTEYTSSNFAQYRVRAYDMSAGRLLRRIVSDRTSWETTMEGWPISRANRDGWAFTLYGGFGGTPFIHALDTRHAEAVCIDLPWGSEPTNIWNDRLHWDAAGHLVVRGPRGRVLVTVDRKNLRVLSFVRNP